MNLLDKTIIPLVDKHKFTFLLIILLLANGYQYIDNKMDQRACAAEAKLLNERLYNLTTETYQYERKRSEKLEFILNTITKIKNEK